MRRWGVVVGTTAMLAVAGCSSGQSTPGPADGAPPSSASAADLCDRLATAINHDTGSSWTSPQQSDNGPIHQCSWTAAADKALTVQVADGESHTGFMDNRALVVTSGGAVKALSDLGAEAYSQMTGSTSFVAARQGQVGVTVQLQGGDVTATVAITRAALSALT